MKSASLGLSVALDYKRFVLMSGTQYEIGRTKVEMIPNDPLDYPNYFIVDRNSLIFPVQLIYKAGRATNFCAIFNGGITYHINWYTERFKYLDDDLDDWSDTGTGYQLYVVPYEMYGILYNEYDFFSVNAGIGLKAKNTYTFLEIDRRIGLDKNKFPVARYFNINISFTKLINFQKLKRGYSIYLD